MKPRPEPPVLLLRRFAAEGLLAKGEPEAALALEIAAFPAEGRGRLSPATAEAWARIPARELARGREFASEIRRREWAAGWGCRLELLRAAGRGPGGGAEPQREPFSRLGGGRGDHRLATPRRSCGT